MNTIKNILAISALAMGTLTPMGSFAQTMMDHGKMDMSQASASMTDGEIKKVDQSTGKVTIKHGEIKHMDMPGMTMVFVVKDKALLDKTAIGAKIQFMVMSESGQMVVTDIQPTK